MGPGRCLPAGLAQSDAKLRRTGPELKVALGTTFTRGVGCGGVRPPPRAHHYNRPYRAPLDFNLLVFVTRPKIQAKNDQNPLH